jgi:hypothetical protein
MCRMVFLMCTFDLNVLQGLPENPRHDVCEPHHLHDDLQRHRERWGQFFSTCRIQRSALEFRLLQNSVLWRNHGLKFLIPFYSLLIFGGELTKSFCGSCTLIK